MKKVGRFSKGWNPIIGQFSKDWNPIIVGRFSKGWNPIIGRIIGHTKTVGRFSKGWNPIIGSDDVAMVSVAKQPPKRNPFAANYISTSSSTRSSFAANCISTSSSTRQYCTRTTSSSLKQLQSASVMPLLMIPPEAKWTINGGNDDQHKDGDKDYYHFYNYHRKEVTSSRKRPIPGLPDDAPWICPCHGWVMFMNPTNGSLYLVNPFHDYNDHAEDQGFNPYYVPLPPLDNSLIISSGGISTKHDNIYIKKLAMSAAPYDDNCKMVAIVGPSGDLVFCKPRENESKWTPLKGLQKADNQSYHYNDVIYSSHDQLFYAIGGEFNYHYYFDGWDLNGPHPEGTLINPSLVDP